jgi:hypothetical protein
MQLLSDSLAIVLNMLACQWFLASFACMFSWLALVCGGACLTRQADMKPCSVVAPS